MIKCAILVTTLLSALNGLAQQRDCSLQKDSLTNELFVLLPDHRAEPVGGLPALGRELSKNVKYPTVDNGSLDSRIFVAFIVDVSGNVKGERILHGTPEIANQLVRIVKNMSWTAATCNGKPVASMYIFPVNLHPER